MIRAIRGLSKSFHIGGTYFQFRGKSKKSCGITYSHSYSLYSQRRTVENEWENLEYQWNDDEDEQKQLFNQEEKKEEEEKKFKCEYTNELKRPGTVDCDCEVVCMVKILESLLKIKH